MDYKLIGVKFHDNPTAYVFKCHYDVIEGDHVVVDTQYGFKVAVVSSTEYSGDFEDSKNTLKEVVCRINMTDYNNRREREKRVKTLKKQMDKKVKELQDLAIYEMLAEKDESLKELLTEFKELI